jgi:hypothetical protein
VSIYKDQIVKKNREERRNRVFKLPYYRVGGQTLTPGLID